MLRPTIIEYEFFLNPTDNRQSLPWQKVANFSGIDSLALGWQIFEYVCEAKQLEAVYFPGGVNASCFSLIVAFHGGCVPLLEEL